MDQLVSSHSYPQFSFPFLLPVTGAKTDTS